MFNDETKANQPELIYYSNKSNSDIKLCNQNQSHLFDTMKVPTHSSRFISLPKNEDGRSENSLVNNYIVAVEEHKDSHGAIGMEW